MHTQSMSHSVQPECTSALFSLRRAGHCSKEVWRRKRMTQSEVLTGPVGPQLYRGTLGTNACTHAHTTHKYTHTHTHTLRHTHTNACMHRQIGSACPSSSPPSQLPPSSSSPSSSAPLLGTTGLTRQWSSRSPPGWQSCSGVVRGWRWRGLSRGGWGRKGRGNCDH